LREFIGLGATLGSDFTAHELRSAYRTLARRYHPDRHPASSEIEKARLARAFAEMSGSHRHLLTALRESTPKPES
jgi:DnaJ-class molecular chaperone